MRMKYSDRNFTKENRYANSQSTHGKMLNVTNNQGNKIQTTTRYYFTPTRIEIIPNADTNKYWQGCENSGGGNVK